MKEIIFFGRGGQGGVTGAQILAEAAVLCGKYSDCSSFPSFGAERRGAPIEAYCRISNHKIWTRMAIQTADMAMVLDETIFGQHIVDKLKPHGVLLLNTPKCPNDIYALSDFQGKKVTIITSDLTQICFDLSLLNQESQPILNTPILGLVTKTNLGLLLDDLAPAITDHIGEKKAGKNIEAATLAANHAQIQEF